MWRPALPMPRTCYSKMNYGFGIWIFSCCQSSLSPVRSLGIFHIRLEYAIVICLDELLFHFYFHELSEFKSLSFTLLRSGLIRGLPDPPPVPSSPSQDDGSL